MGLAAGKVILVLEVGQTNNELLSINQLICIRISVTDLRNVEQNCLNQNCEM